MSWDESYMRELRQRVAEDRARRAAEQPSAANDVDRLEALKQRIAEWFNSRPREAHPEYYYMSDLKRLLGATPQELGTTLHELGWTRRRVWSRGEPFRQRWYPPSQPDSEQEK